MAKYETSLIIGRFNPLCLNHLDLFNQARDISKNLIVGVGVPNFEIAASRFSIDELIEYKLKNLIPYEKTETILSRHIDARIFKIEDIFDEEHYADYVLSKIESTNARIDSCVLIGENEWTNRCFRNKLDITKSKDRLGFHATDVRRELYMTGKSKRIVEGYSDREIKELALAQEILDSNGVGKIRLLAKYNFLFGG